MSAISTDYTSSSPSFFSSLWLTGILLRVGLIAGLIAMIIYEALPITFLAGFLAADISAFVWSTHRYNTAALAHLKSTGRFWSVTGGYVFFAIAGIVTLAAWISMLYGMEFPKRTQNFQEAAPTVSAMKSKRYRISYTKDGKAIHFNGVIAPGAVIDFEKYVLGGDTPKTAILTSSGGHIYEAREFAEDIRKYGMDTHVEMECNASCVALFMAGEARTLGRGAQLGFHRYGLDFEQVLPHVSPLREMRIDQQYYLERGVSLDFLDQVFDLSRDSIWYPSRKELLQAGVLTQ